MWLHCCLFGGDIGDVVPMEVGVREVRNNLSWYLVRVRRREEVVVTDRGHAIARVLSPRDRAVLV
jgi:prevent-host-death family protein